MSAITLTLTPVNFLANVVPTARIFFLSLFRREHPPPINSSPFVTAYPTFSSATLSGGAY